MWYIKTEPNPSGAYGGPQSNPFPGAAAMSDEQMKTLIEYNGFVTLHTEVVDGVLTVTDVVPNIAAWEEWKAGLPPEELPEESPTELEQLRADVDYIAMETGVEL